MLNTSDSVIELFVVTYDSDPTKMYTFVDFNKALASIETSCRGYIGEDCPQTDWLVDQLVETVRVNRDQRFIPIRLNTLDIMLCVVDLDSQNRVVKTLADCYDQVDDETKAKIELLFAQIEV
jgi:hypothetical protein